MMAGMGVDGFIRRHGEDRTDAYDRMARFLHWTIAALLCMQYATKLIPDGTFGIFTDDRLDLWHVSIGPTVLALMVFRLVWRLTHRVPSPPNDLPLVLQFVSRVTHWLFYGLLLLLPILGWIAASAYRVKPYLLGLMRLPELVAPNERLGGQIGELHGKLAWALLAIVALNVTGAMYHALVKRDGVLSRMLPG